MAQDDALKVLLNLGYKKNNLLKKRQKQAKRRLRVQGGSNSGNSSQQSNQTSQRMEDSQQEEISLIEGLEVKGYITCGPLKDPEHLKEYLFPTTPSFNRKKNEKDPSQRIIYCLEVVIPSATKTESLIVAEFSYILETLNNISHFIIFPKTQYHPITREPLNQNNTFTTTPLRPIPANVIHTEFSKTFPEFNHYKNMRIFHSMKYSTLILTAITDSVNELQNVLLKYHEKQSDWIDAVMFENSDFNRYDNCKIKVGKIESRLTPHSYLKHFRKFFGARWNSIAKSYSTGVGRGLLRLDLFSFMNDKKSLHCLKEIQEFFRVLRLGNCKSIFARVGKDKDMLLREFKKSCEVKSDAEILFFMNEQDMNLYCIGPKIHDQGGKIQEFINYLEERIFKTGINSVQIEEIKKLADAKKSRINVETESIWSENRDPNSSYDYESGEEDELDQTIFDEELTVDSKSKKFILLKCGHEFELSDLRHTLNIHLKRMAVDLKTGSAEKFRMKCPVHGCGKLILASEVKLVLSEDRFERFIKINFYRFLKEKSNRVRICGSEFCSNILERRKKTTLYKVCELCNNKVYFGAKPPQEDLNHQLKPKLQIKGKAKTKSQNQTSEEELASVQNDANGGGAILPKMDQENSKKGHSEDKMEVNSEDEKEEESGMEIAEKSPQIHAGDSDNPDDLDEINENQADYKNITLPHDIANLLQKKKNQPKEAETEEWESFSEQYQSMIFENLGLNSSILLDNYCEFMTSIDVFTPSTTHNLVSSFILRRFNPIV